MILRRAIQALCQLSYSPEVLGLGGLTQALATARITA